MKYRKLRIAWSMGWGVLCVLLVVLWVRSYWRCESVIGGGHLLTSLRGEVFADAALVTSTPNPNPVDAWSTSFLNDHVQIGSFPNTDTSAAHALWSVHYAYLVAAVCALMAAPWLPWRFSLLTLLAAITVVAGLLGAAVVLFGE